MNTIRVYLKEITGQDAQGQDTYGSTVTDFDIGYTDVAQQGSYGDIVLKKNQTYVGTNIIPLTTAQNTAIKYQVFLDSSCSQKAGFIISISAPDQYDRKTFMLYSPVNGAYYCTAIPYNNGTTPIYMIFSLLVSVSSSTPSIKEVAEKIVTSWGNPLSTIRTKNMEDLTADGASPILFIRDANPQGENYNLVYERWITGGRALVCGLNNAYNYYTFLTGEFKIPTFYLTLEDGRKLYLGKVQPTGLENNTWYRDRVNSADATALYTDDPACVMWDYQAGSPLCEFFDKVGDTITLKNGTVLGVTQTTPGHSRIKLSMVKTQQGGNLQKEWFVGRWFGSIDANYTANTSLPSPLKNQAATGMSGGGYCTVPCFMLNPKYNASVNDVLDTDPTGDFSKFGPDYFEVIAPTLGVGIDWPQATYEDWGFETFTRVAWTEVVTSSYNQNVSPENNFMCGCDNSTYGWNVLTDNLNNAEKWKIILGIEEGVEPIDPEHGGGSIGGGGKTGGGDGNFDDGGDNIDFGGTRNGIGNNSLFTNWYIGTTGSSDEIASLNAIETYIQSSSTSIGDNTDAFDRLISLKHIAFAKAPTNATLGGIQIAITDSKSVHLPSAKAAKSPRYSTETLRLNFTLPEYFGSFLDYEPYTKVQVYLPFSGVHDLNASEVVGKSLTLMAKIDWFTGDILYLIKVNDGNTNSVIYRFNGNAATELPLTGKDYGGKVSSLVSMGLGAASAAAGVVMQNPTMAVGGAMGFVSGAASYVAKEGQYTLKQKGNFGASIGFLDVDRPYLLVTRPKQIVADDYGSTYGWPSMQSKKLSALTGFVKVAECHWEGLGTATEEEIAEIDRIMKSGAIL